MRARRFLFLCVVALSACSKSLAPQGAGGLTAPSAPSVPSVLFDSKASMSEKKAYLMATAFGDPAWQKRWWIEKAARTLRAGVGLTGTDDIVALSAMTEDQIIDYFMKDPRFGDMVLDFNMYFLGFKLDQLKDADGTYSHQIYAHTPAINSAQQLLAGGDYLQLFDFYGSFFESPQSVQSSEDPADAKLSDRDRHLKFISTFETPLRAAIDSAASSEAAGTAGTATPDSLCAILKPHLTAVDNGLFNLLPQDLAIPFFQVDPFGYFVLQAQCGLSQFPGVGPQHLSVAAMLKIMQGLYARNEVLFAETLNYEESVYAPKTLGELKPFNMTGITTAPWLQVGILEAVTLPNSSTNHDRKRSAYVLKHFFCDDLTPIGVENPAQHAGTDPHGSDPSCFACHYKLDPMAGFFRNFGTIFIDFTGLPKISFDDNVTVDRATYENAWRAPAGSGRDFNVGYIRSVKDEKQNSYGDSLSDLSKILREAPEAKRCLVKRFFAYAINEQQTMDAGYLDFLANKFTADAQSNSSLAMKNLVRTLLLSQSFAQGNLDPNQCYDYAPGEDPTNAPPCRVAHVFQKNCASCHSSTSDSGQLDLTKWTRLPDGTMTFPHLDMDGKQMSSSATLAMISERLSTLDPKKRMPKMRDMSAQDRTDLFLWTQDEWTKQQGSP